MAKKYTDQAMQNSATMSREDYKAVKHMDKVQLTAYLQRVYRRGYEAGVADEKKRRGSIKVTPIEAPSEHKEG